ncbi:hypothetical protein [Flammeovirga pacifica]|uniref:Uncharacterized protein n=1 Tax=Flammeovirga pacifica TaxID=915059 RepID=A0A1S1YTC2_FLAPC|nr:hypothetical protein [Flammeovirga pacifica]OHX64055.1 hypothetical protein NH26_20820 [Flammeovirga pacifica]
MSIQAKSLRIMKALPQNKKVLLEEVLRELEIETSNTELSCIANCLKRNGLVDLDTSDHKIFVGLTDEGKEIILNI